jgi:hypothetical protein
MATYIFRHKVGDIDAWLNGHQERMELFGPLSKGNFRTFQDLDDPKSVLLLLDTDETLEKIGAMINDPEIIPLREKHTVLEPITVSKELEL